MGQQTSREELLYEQVSYGNVEGIKLLRSEGAGLEWVDREGKTPLIAACMKPDLSNVAKALIELGADVNAYRRGFRAGTPLHHAAKRGLDETVKLLLSHGANALVMNDDFQTPLDVARANGHSQVVRMIESRICSFSGWLRELDGPGFLEAFVPQGLSQKVWAVVIPRNSRDPTKPQKFELAVYPSQQAAKSCKVIKLWKANIEEPDFSELDASLVIFDRATKTRFKFSSANEGDKQQLEWFYNACIGMHQLNIPTPIPATAPSSDPEEDKGYAMTFSGSHSATEERLPQSLPTDSSCSKISNADGFSNSGDNSSHNDQVRPTSKITSSGRLDEPSTSGTYKGWEVSEVGTSKNPAPHHQSQQSTQAAAASIQSSSPPAASSISDECPDDDGLIVYPTVDSSPVDVSMLTSEVRPPAATSKLNEDSASNDSRICVICLDGPKEGACVPCGHVIGCMSCLNDIKAKGWGCPVCRAKVDHVVKLYTV